MFRQLTAAALATLALAACEPTAPTSNEPYTTVPTGDYVLFNIEVGQDVLTELVEGFRFNDAVLRHLVMGRDEADTEQSLIMKNKDEKGDKPERGERRRRDDEEGEAGNAASTESDNAEAA